MEIFYAKSNGGQLDWNNTKAVSDYLSTIEGKSVWVEIHRETGVRTDTQSRAIHLYLEMLATELNNAGYTVQIVLKNVMDISWTKNLCKELIWRPIQEALLSKRSTTKLARQQDIDTVYDHINQNISEKFGLHIPFPTRELKDNAPMR